MTDVGWHSAGEIQVSSFTAGTSYSHQIHLCTTLPLRDRAADKWGRKAFTRVFANCHLYETGGIFLLQLKKNFCQVLLLIKSWVFDFLKSNRGWVARDGVRGKWKKSNKKASKKTENPLRATDQLESKYKVLQPSLKEIDGNMRNVAITMLPPGHYFLVNETLTLFKYQPEILWPQHISPY